MNAFLVLFVAIFFAASAQLLVKKGVSLLGSVELSLPGFFNVVLQVFKNFYIISGLLLLGGAFFLYLFSISKKQLNVVYPVTASLSIVLVSLLSWILFRENLSWMQISGIVLIIFGVFLLIKV